MWLYGALSELVFSGCARLIDRKYTEGLDERHGRYSSRVPRGAVWVHAVSVGEVQSALPLVTCITEEAPELPVLVTTVTQTGAAMVRQLMPNVVHAYYPWDAPSIVSRALGELRPRCYVTMETELWPVMTDRLYRAGIPAFLVNGRISDRSFHSYRRLKFFWGSVLDRYRVIMARDSEDAERFKAICSHPERVIVTGENKTDALLIRRQQEKLPVFDEPDRPIILAGSTHPGEDEIIHEAWLEVKKRCPGARLIIAPRHPERAESVAELFSGCGAGCRFSAPTLGWDVMIVDRIGKLFCLYGTAQAAFVGGTLVPRGGQNVYEPAVWGCPFCLGPSYSDFREPTEELLRLGVCRLVSDASSIAEFFIGALNENLRDKIAESARVFFDGKLGSARRSWQEIDRQMTELKGQWR